MTIDKASLKVGESLKHSMLGKVVYSAQCDALEKEHGESDTLFVEVSGKIRCVTLGLIDRKGETNESTNSKAPTHQPGI